MRLILWERVFNGKLITAQLVKRISSFLDPCVQEPATGPLPMPEESYAQNIIISYTEILIIIQFKSVIILLHSETRNI